MNQNLLNTTFELPCGVILQNRLVKSAMTERMSNRNYEPTSRHERLYEEWSMTGAGLLITGNVVFDQKHMESAGNVCFDDEKMIPKLKRWADSGKVNGNELWVQISHAGRQTNRFTNTKPLAPSNVQLKKIGLFGKPKTMSELDIQNVIDGFIKAARISKDAGFTGVQIHSAHGYLLSQFLSPITNKRSDQWGGTIENRSRLLITLVRGIRDVVGPDYPISVKLNSSDFQRGGFTEEESLQVVQMLDREKIDLLEISGGTYEKVVFFMMNEDHVDVKESTKLREAYFIDFAKKVRAISKIPLLITGGFRSFNFCNEVLKNGELDLVGMARPFITNRNEISDFIKGDIPNLENAILRTGISKFDDAAEGGFYARQIIRLAKGKKFNMNLSAMISSVFLVWHEFKTTVYRKLSL